MEPLINIDVPNLEAAIEFYLRATGLKLGRRLFQDTVAELTGAPVRIFLLQKAPGSSATPSCLCLATIGDIGPRSISTSSFLTLKRRPQQPSPPARDSRDRFKVTSGAG